MFLALKRKSSNPFFPFRVRAEKVTKTNQVWPFIIRTVAP